MLYFSLDIETTGLDPKQDQILELALVMEDTEEKQELTKLPYFHTYVLQERYSGDAYALALNSEILKYLSKKNQPNVTRNNALFLNMERWIDQRLIEKGLPIAKDDCEAERIILAGKNVGAFDLQFLMQLPYYRPRFRHRILDPMMYYFNVKTDVQPPSMSDCLTRAGLSGLVNHSALSDARQVIQLMRAARG